MNDNDSTIQPFSPSTSSDVVISVEGLWKQYRYGTISHRTLRKDIQSWWARIHGKPDPNLPLDSNLSHFTDNVSQGVDRFWALQDINCEVKQGDVLGIIGRNGAGKSTLLKIMSRVTTPTKGQIKLKGRIASLLEVGTGFHPELTGRENIFLNGAILGMTKAEIRKKFDEIVAFAEIEKFIDTPVKRYSSGMYVRLAFAVAAHLEPEILLVDEVLAVGDAQFQKKCLGKMGDVAREGRTVLFVSHNMTAIDRLCQRVVLLSEGTLQLAGPTAPVIKAYQSEFEKLSGTTTLDNPDLRRGDGRIRFTNVNMVNIENSDIIRLGEPLIVKLSYKAIEDVEDTMFYFWITNEFNDPIFFCSNHFSGEKLNVKKGSGAVQCIIRRNPLPPGKYLVNIDIYSKGIQCDFIRNAYLFTVLFGDYYGTGIIPSDRSKVLIDYEWSIKSD
jgi:lipopolysaccharide transport system ATP-binding protein